MCEFPVSFYKTVFVAVDLFTPLCYTGCLSPVCLGSHPPPDLNQVRRRWPAARIIYDTVDLHFLREARVKMVGSGSTNLEGQARHSQNISPPCKRTNIYRSMLEASPSRALVFRDRVPSK